MKVAIGADHAGFGLKRNYKKASLRSRLHVHDCGTHNEDPVDYPDIAEQVAHAVKHNQVERGIMLCGSGVGASIAANKDQGHTSRCLS